MQIESLFCAAFGICEIYGQRCGTGGDVATCRNKTAGLIKKPCEPAIIGGIAGLQGESHGGDIVVYCYNVSAATVTNSTIVAGSKGIIAAAEFNYTTATSRRWHRSG